MYMYFQTTAYDKKFGTEMAKHISTLISDLGMEIMSSLSIDSGGAYRCYDLISDGLTKVRTNEQLYFSNFRQLP